MDCINNVKQIVNVIAYYFRGETQPECFPKRLEYNNQIIAFSENGRRHTTLKDRRLVHVFDMTDGTANYQLEFDAATLTWTLISVTTTQEALRFGSLAGLNYAARA